jgi:hypothetical protein
LDEHPKNMKDKDIEKIIMRVVRMAIKDAMRELSNGLTDDDKKRLKAALQK